MVEKCPEVKPSITFLSEARAGSVSDPDNNFVILKEHLEHHLDKVKWCNMG